MVSLEMLQLRGTLRVTLLVEIAYDLLTFSLQKIVFYFAGPLIWSAKKIWVLWRLMRDVWVKLPLGLCMEIESLIKKFW